MSFTIDYRPQNFDNIVGQKHIKTILKQQMISWSSKANYLFFWPRWTGKTTTARIMAKALNCINIQDANPCNNCTNCTLIDKATTLDFIEIDAASHTWVDNIRDEIINKALYQPTILSKKIYIIDEVHMLSKGAFNALLKIMEDPPSYMTFIIATTEVNKIPDTIISRCQVFQFRKLSIEQIVWRLTHIIENENIKADPAALHLIAKLADGIMRDANKYLEQVSVLGDVSVENVTQFLGIVGDEKIISLLRAIKEWSFDDCLRWLNELEQEGVDLTQFAKQVLSYTDEHFQEDMTHMSAMTELFSNIISSIKYFPHPLLSYKTKIFHYLQGDTKQQPKVTWTSQVFIPPSWSENKEDAKTLSSWASPKDLLSSRQEPNPKALSDPKTSTSDDPKTSTSDEEKISKEKEEAGGQIKEPKNKYDAIKTQLMDRIDKKTIKWLLAKSAIIKNIDDSHVEMLVINKMAELTLSKDETTQLLEKILSDVIGKNIKLSISYIKKEDYFASLL